MSEGLGPDAWTAARLARMTLWLAYCWNDHNFQKRADQYARECAQELGIAGFEDANDWLQGVKVENPRRTLPAAALMRSRYVTTWAHAAVDGKNHFSDWGDWMPTTYAHAKAVTDSLRNIDPVIYEMRPLYLKPQPLTRQQIDAVMTEHYPLSSLLCEEVDAFERCVRDLERLHGIGA